MGEVRAKVFEFAVEVNEAGDATIPGGAALQLPAGWTADHLLLMALVRCSIESLRYSARREGSELEASGSATGKVTRRASDGRFAFVEISCRIELQLTPPSADLAKLTAKAEEGCFIGASLTVKPSYEWLAVASGSA